MDIIKARKHNAGYPQGYEGEDIVTPFEETILALKVMCDIPINTSSWDKPDVIALAALKTRLRFMQDGDRFTSGDVVLISKVLERMGTLRYVGLEEWAKQPCNNPVCKEHASSRRVRRRRRARTTSEGQVVSDRRKVAFGICRAFVMTDLRRTSCKNMVSC